MISNLDHGELFGYIYFRLDTVPTESIRFVHGRSGSTIFGMSVYSGGQVTLEDGTSLVGSSAALQTGTIYRIGWHYQKGTGSNGVLEGYLAQGDAAFGSPFASKTNSAKTANITELRFGSSGGLSPLDGRIDYIQVDDSVMPAPTSIS